MIIVREGKKIIGLTASAPVSAKPRWSAPVGAKPLWPVSVRVSPCQSVLRLPASIKQRSARSRFASVAFVNINQIEDGEFDALVCRLFAALVKAGNPALGCDGEVGITARAGVQDSGRRPCRAFVMTRSDRHARPACRAGRIREQDDASWLIAGAGAGHRPGISPDARLAYRFDQGVVKTLPAPRRAAIVAEGDLPRAAGFVIIAHVEHQAAIGEFDNLAFVDVVDGRTAASFHVLP